MKAFLLAVTLAVAVQAQTLPTVRNFGAVVAGQIYRGARPTNTDLFNLASFGIKTVVDLEGKKTAGREGFVVHDTLGLNFVTCPLNGLAAPTNEQIDEILSAVRNAVKPVFIHCKHGEDRTGTVVAALRISEDGWMNDRAMQEALAFHINPLQFGMKRYIMHYMPPSRRPTDDELKSGPSKPAGAVCMVTK